MRRSSFKPSATCSVQPRPLLSFDCGSLENIGDLEKYIDQSAVISIFLSMGYFKARNCLREVVGTLEQKKPYLFVHEADPAKGGGTLEALRLELQNEAHREALFDGRRVTVWHRIADFQTVSLLQIAEDMLKFSPEYVERNALPLYVPSGLLEQRLLLPTPVVLFVSDNNPGAAQAAAEMTSLLSELSITSSLQSTSKSECAPVTTSTSEAPTWNSTAQPTHFLLYLNNRTYSDRKGEALAAQVRDARQAGMQIAMIHENDPDLGGCEFGTFFQTTPPDLIKDGLYTKLAVAFVHGEEHRKVSRALLAKALGANEGEAMSKAMSGAMSKASRLRPVMLQSWSRMTFRKNSNRPEFFSLALWSRTNLPDYGWCFKEE